MNNRTSTSLFLVAAILLATLTAAPALDAQRIHVRLLNMSDAPFGPVLVATHPSSQSPLLDPSEAPSESLRSMAGGSEVMLEDELEELERRHSHVRAGRLPGPEPGQAVSAEIRVTSYHRNISLAASLPGGGVAALAPRHVHGVGRFRVDLLAWEVGDTVLVHRARPSPIARAWLQYKRPSRTSRASHRASPSLTPAQQAEREQCLGAAPHCVWRLEGGAGVCIACISPLRPNAARTHCVE